VDEFAEVEDEAVFVVIAVQLDSLKGASGDADL